MLINLNASLPCPAISHCAGGYHVPVPTNVLFLVFQARSASLAPLTGSNATRVPAAANALATIVHRECSGKYDSNKPMHRPIRPCYSPNHMWWSS